MLISVLGREDTQILTPLTSIFLILSYNDTSRAEVAGREETLTQSLLEGLFKARGSSDAVIVEKALEALANFSVLGLPQQGADRASERAAYERALALDASLSEAHLALGTLLADPATPAALRDPARARTHLERFVALVTERDVAGRKQAADWLAWLSASAAQAAAAVGTPPPR